MSKWIPRLAASGFIFCLLYFTSAVAIIISADIGILATQGTSVYSPEYFSWQKSTIGSIMIVTQNLLFATIWVHIIFFIRIYKEYFFINMAIVIHLTWMLYIALFNHSFLAAGVQISITLIDSLMLIVGLWLIKHPYLRGFVRWYTVAVIGEFLLSQFVAPWFYDELSIHWLLLNPVIMNLLPYSVLTVMFLSIWVRSRNVYATIK